MEFIHNGASMAQLLNLATDGEAAIVSTQQA